GLEEHALSELRSARSRDANPALEHAAKYAVWHSGDPVELAERLLTHPNSSVAQAALEALAERPEAAQRLITREWVDQARNAPDPDRRILAAVAVRLRPEGSDPAVLHGLLRDTDPRVTAAACQTAATLQSRVHLEGLLRLLPNARFRQHALDALASYGEKIAGTLGDILLDTSVPASVRRQIPRVLRRISSQRSVDVLMAALSEQDLTVRAQVLKALNSLREDNQKLNFGRDSVLKHIHDEARYYYTMSAALKALGDNTETPAARLLVKTLQERLRYTLERLFRLLGLRYPPREIHAAFLAMSRKSGDQYTAAIEFLDNVLEREVKRFVLPLLDEDGRLNQVGRDLFGLAELDHRGALRELIRSGDAWLVACAVSTAAELGLNDLRPEIETLAHKAGTEVGPVAQAALARLA
ncbi:MAG TPA: hypothetical protein VES20_07490, partial [Bryobacteraceae bacterium]|nr:hypothetical protein [Bryobacteraceae bacterium]